MSPYNGDIRQVAFLEPIIRRADLYLAITGRFWWDKLAASDVAHWLPKMRHLDLAIDRAEFPFVKASFNPPGRRRFLYIGNAGWTKNVGYLSALARSGHAIYWMGAGAIPALVPLGYNDFRTVAARELVATHDFMITVGEFDANPATILEAMAWGLIPVCTPESGYCNQPGIVNIPLCDLEGAGAVLRRLQEVDEEALLQMQRTNLAVLDAHYNWDRFAGDVVSAIESDEHPLVQPLSPARRLKLGVAARISPYSIWRPSNLARDLGARLKRGLRARLAARQGATTTSGRN